LAIAKILISGCIDVGSREIAESLLKALVPEAKSIFGQGSVDVRLVGTRICITIEADRISRARALFNSHIYLLYSIINTIKQLDKEVSIKSGS